MKLIAEPWDLGEGGYQVGNFPPGWTEWNGQYRDTMRAYWKGDGGLIGEFARRLTGSQRPLRAQRAAAVREHQLRHRARRLHAARPRHATTTSTTRPTAKTTATAATTTARWNCGVEGPTDDPAINALRARQKRNFLATLLLSQGVPMLLGGDELGRTQRGNNNAYCQDNELVLGRLDLRRPSDAPARVRRSA